MTRAIAGALLTILACSAARAQSAGPKIEFEVASIKPSAPPSGRGMRVGFNGGPGTKDPARIVYENMSLSGLVTIAYDLKRYQLSAPGWLDSERFDIQAKVPEGATKEQVRLMMQNLLAERFKLTIHHETKEMPMFQLVVAKGGHKLKEVVEEPAPKDGDAAPATPGPMPRITMDKNGYPVLPPGKGPMTIMLNGRARTQGQETMEQFAGMLANQMGRPVTDATGLKGKYEISLYWEPDGISMGGAPPPPPPGAVGPPPGAGGPTASLPEGESGPAMFSALQEQLGLKLEPKKGPVDIIVVDHIEKVPTEN